MRRRTRILAGIFALVAMTFSLTETVVASMCSPGMSMGAEMTGASAVAEPVSSNDRGPAASHEQESEGQDMPEGCPFGPAAAQGCAGAASLPAHAAAAPLAAPSAELARSVEQAERDLLLERALFHPPRA